MELDQRIGGQRRRRVFVSGNAGVEPLGHGIAVRDGRAQFLQHRRKMRRQCRFAATVVDVADVNVNETLDGAAGRAFAEDACELPGFVAQGADDRMDDHQHGKAGRLDFPQDRVQQEGHVVIDHLNDGEVRHGAGAGLIVGPHPRLAARALAEELEGQLCDRGKAARLVSPQLGVAGIVEKQRGELRQFRRTRLRGVEDGALCAGNA